MCIEYVLIAVTILLLGVYIWWWIVKVNYRGIRAFKSTDKVDIYYRMFERVRRLTIVRIPVDDVFEIEPCVNGERIMLGQNVDLEDFIRNLKTFKGKSRNARFIYYLLTHKRGNLTSLFSYRSLEERKQIEIILVTLSFEIMDFFTK